MPKRLTSPSVIRNWLVVLAGHCASTTRIVDLKAPIELMAIELSVLYPPGCFTTDTASDISMAFQHGFPTMSQLRKELDKNNRETGKQGEGGKTGRVELSEARLADGRVAALDFADRVLLAQYDRRIREITAEDQDPHWHSFDPELKKLSKRVNLASTYRSYMPKVWELLTNPPEGVEPEPEVAFLLKQSGLLKAQTEERARLHAERKEQLNRPPPESYEDEANF